MVEMIRSSSDHAVFTWDNKIYKYILAVETDDILIATQHRIRFNIFTQKSDTLFDNIFQ